MRHSNVKKRNCVAFQWIKLSTSNFFLWNSFGINFTSIFNLKFKWLIPRTGSLQFRLIRLVVPNNCCIIHFIIPRYSKCIESRNTDLIGSKFGISNNDDLPDLKWCSLWLCLVKVMFVRSLDVMLGKTFFLFIVWPLHTAHTHNTLHDLYIFLWMV